jgi:hypothetical protein
MCSDPVLAADFVAVLAFVAAAADVNGLVVDHTMSWVHMIS